MNCYQSLPTLQHNTDYHQKVHTFFFHEEYFIPSAVHRLKEAKGAMWEISRKNDNAHHESFLEVIPGRPCGCSSAMATQDIAKRTINIILQYEGIKRAYQSLSKYLQLGEFGALIEAQIEPPDKTVSIISDSL
jgi:hypothetical protein